MAFRHRRRAVLAVATGVLVALSAAGPALADDVGTLQQAPAPPVVEPLDADAEPIESSPTPIPEPSAPPSVEPSAPDEEPTVVTVGETDSGSLDVSVRVLSPGNDEQSSQDDLGSGVISSQTAPDITDSADPAATDSGATPTDSGATESTEATATNVNVSVRVLSPGDNGPVTQSTASDVVPPSVESVDLPPATTADTDSEAARSSETASAEADPGFPSGEQYQNADSQYQSGDDLREDAWYWLWYLSVDCAGDVSSTSSETGLESSLNWVWEWTWDWSCNSPPHPPALVAPETGSGSPSSSSTTAQDTSRAPSDSEADGSAPGAPWLWTWTFTFCGETVSASIPVAVQATLRWTWDWIWSWTCSASASTMPNGAGPPAPPPSPAPRALSSTSSWGNGAGSWGDGAGGAPSESAPAQPAAATQVLPLLPAIPLITVFPFPAVPPIELDPPFESSWPTVSVVVELEPSPPAMPVVSFPSRSGANAGAALVDQAVPFAGVPTTHSETARSRPASMEAIAPAWEGQQKETVSGGSRAAKSDKPHRAEPRSPRTPLAPLLPPPFRGAGVSGTSGGIVPSGAVFGTAALIGFVMLAAPGLGRRIRVARELSPHGRYGSSIDRPG